jgi:heme-degrading monooxygenase HmoA
MTTPCRTPDPPYYAVIFTSVRSGTDSGYAEANARMMELAQGMEGFLGVDSAADALGITVSYWRDIAAIAKWRDHAEHRVVQDKGRSDWYRSYTLRVARVEHQRAFTGRDDP